MAYFLSFLRFCKVFYSFNSITSWLVLKLPKTARPCPFNKLNTARIFGPNGALFVGWDDCTTSPEGWHATVTLQFVPVFQHLCLQLAPPPCIVTTMRGQKTSGFQLPGTRHYWSWYRLRNKLPTEGHESTLSVGEESKIKGEKK